MSENTPAKQTALIIDDERQIRRLLRVCLEANNYKVLEAANGEEGISSAAQHRPDVVLLDVLLPDTTGLGSIR